MDRAQVTSETAFVNEGDLTHQSCKERASGQETVRFQEVTDVTQMDRVSIWERAAAGQVRGRIQRALNIN